MEPSKLACAKSSDGIYLGAYVSDDTYGTGDDAEPSKQFCGPDPMIQQAQAQSQAQIQALNQQNALLNQQLHAQHMTHMQNLQQLATHTAPFIESSSVHSTNRSPSISLSCRTYANSTNSSSWTYTPVVQH